MTVLGPDDEFAKKLKGAVEMPDGSLILPDGSHVRKHDLERTFDEMDQSDDPFDRLLTDSTQQEFREALGKAKDDESFTKDFHRMLREEGRASDFLNEMSGGDRASTWIMSDEDDDDEEDV